MKVQGVFTSLETFVDSNELISTDKYMDELAGVVGVHYFKRDFIRSSGSWRGNFVESVFNSRSSLKELTIVLGHSDTKVGLATLAFLKSLGIGKVFGVNTLPIRNFSFSIPLGLTNNCDDSPIHRILGNEAHFLMADKSSQFNDTFSRSLYVNFTKSNNSSVRSKLLKIIQGLEDKYNLIHDLPNFSEEGRVRFLRNCREVNLVLCPEGNGFDTHRFWETIYMGGIPVILTNPYLDSIVGSLPIIQLKSWSQLQNVDFLERKWAEARNKLWDNSLIKKSSWLQVIRGS